jgi:hypothetical protein
MYPTGTKIKYFGGAQTLLTDKKTQLMITLCDFKFPLALNNNCDVVVTRGPYYMTIHNRRFS